MSNDLTVPTPPGGEIVQSPMSIEQIIALAIERGTPVETMERLLAMRTQLRQEAAEEAYDRALAAFQTECPVIPKGNAVMNKDGKTVRYRYTSLEDIKRIAGPILARHGFSWSFDCSEQNGQMRVICNATHEAGHSRPSTFPTPIDADSYMSAPQQFASALTFGKRYALCGAFGIVCGGEDDDAQPAVPQAAKPAAQKTPTPDPRSTIMRELHALGHPTPDIMRMLNERRPEGVEFLTESNMAKLSTMQELCALRDSLKTQEAADPPKSQGYEELASRVAENAMREDAEEIFLRAKARTNCVAANLTALLNRKLPAAQDAPCLKAMLDELELEAMPTLI